MKKIGLSLLMALFCAAIHGQTLEFSQVILVDANVQTVPAGKVWKVEKAVSNQGIVKISTSGTSTASSSTYWNYAVNGNSVPITRIDATNAANNVPTSSSSSSNTNSVYLNIDQSAFPVWLPAGTTLAAGQDLFYLSVIEFTVVP